MNRFFSKTLLSLFFVSTLTNMVRIPSISGKCIGVADGDTITILDVVNQQQKIRLAHIDCPEKKQPFSQEAKKFTSDFCFGKTVRVEHSGKKDRNGRVIGIVYDTQGHELNSELVQAGLAWHFKKYSDDTRYDFLEKSARMKKIGIWSHPDPIEPWAWRKKKN